MWLLFAFFKLASCLILNLEILDIGSLSNFTYISLSEPNWFVMGKKGSFASVVQKNDFSLSTDCEICSIESWASGRSEILIPTSDIPDKKIYISAYQSKESQQNNLTMIIQSNEDTKCLEKCSGNGICNNDGCHCYIGFGGYRCATKLIYVGEKHVKETIGGYQWMFFYKHFSHKNNLEFEILTNDQIDVYLDMKNSTDVIPFFNNSLKGFSIRPGKDEENQEYEWVILTKNQKSRYLLWSLYCNQPENCKIEVFFEKIKRSHGKIMQMAIIFSVLSVFLFIFSILSVKYLKKRRDSSHIKKKELDHQIEMQSIYPRVNVISLSDEAFQCAICLNEFFDEVSGRILPCLHIFHDVCIDSWTLYKNICPICKRTLLIIK